MAALTAGILGAGGMADAIAGSPGLAGGNTMLGVLRIMLGVHARDAHVPVTCRQRAGNMLTTCRHVPKALILAFQNSLSSDLALEADRVIQLPENSDWNWSVQEPTG